MAEGCPHGFGLLKYADETVYKGYFNKNKLEG